MSSHYVHGSWHELDFYHLESAQYIYGFRKEQMHYTSPKPQMLEVVSILIMEVLQRYLTEIIEEGEPHTKVEAHLNSIALWFYSIAQKHEEFLSKR